MQTVFLDFTRSRRPTALAGALLFALGGLALAAVAAWNLLYWEPLASANEKALLAVRARIAKPAAPAIDSAQLAAEWKKALLVAEELNRPWEKLFAALEENVDRPVALLTLEPDAQKGELVLTAEAKNFAEMLGYYRLLQQKDNLRNVTLHTHQINQQDKEKPVRFRITANWEVKS